MIPRPLTMLRDKTLRAALGHFKSRNRFPPINLLDEIPHRTLPERNRLLFEYSRNNLNHEAISLFIETHQLARPINEPTLSCILKVSGSLLDQIHGRQLHSLCIKLGFEDAASVGTSLVDMYMKCDSLQDGRKVFDSMPERNMVTWTSLLTGYTQNGLAEYVFQLFGQMKSEEIKPNLFTFASVLSSCAAQREAEIGKRAHSLLIKLGFESTTFVCNSLINMYSKCGLIEEAKLIFEEMENCRDVVSWNAAIAGLVLNGFDPEALRLFYWMRVEGHKLTQRSFVTAIKLCANLKELNFARQLHCCAMKEGYGHDCNISTALIVVYCKCSG